MKFSLTNVITEIRQKEKKMSGEAMLPMEEAYQMTIYLQELLHEIKDFVMEKGFVNERDEIRFFRDTKPQILGRLIYYNKIYRIETSCPVDKGKMYYNYFSNQLRQLKREYARYICNSDFYRYYRSGRNERDLVYFTLGKINYHEGLNSFVFEIDPHFSTYYDYKVARIISNDLLYNYLVLKINPTEHPDSIFLQEESIKDLLWTESKNALIELIYALYASGAISNGKLGIRKLCMITQVLFKVSFNDIHHAFHRMKTRSGSRTLFLDQLKVELLPLSGDRLKK